MNDEPLIIVDAGTCSCDYEPRPCTNCGQPMTPPHYIGPNDGTCYHIACGDALRTLKALG